MNSVMTVLLEFYPWLLTFLLKCIGMLCKFSEPDWFLETCETPLEPSLIKSDQQNGNSS